MIMIQGVVSEQQRIFRTRALHNIFAKDQFCCLRVCSDPRTQFFVTISVTGFSPLEPNLEFEKFSRGHR